MPIEMIVTALVALIVFVGPFAALGALALRYGVDSRPGIGDRDRRPWLVADR